jgi:hypothetical protein
MSATRLAIGRLLQVLGIALFLTGLLLPIGVLCGLLMRHELIGLLALMGGVILSIGGFYGTVRILRYRVLDKALVHTRSCPNCGRRIAASAPVCPRCETRLWLHVKMIGEAAHGRYHQGRL